MIVKCTYELRVMFKTEGAIDVYMLRIKVLRRELGARWFFFNIMVING